MTMSAVHPVSYINLTADIPADTRLVLGVDVGAVGAIAILTFDGTLLDVHDMPVLHDGPAGRRAVFA
jgi:hypothetical protein